MGNWLALILTLGTTTAATLMVNEFELATELVKQVALDTNVQVTTSPSLKALFE